MWAKTFVSVLSASARQGPGVATEPPVKWKCVFIIEGWGEKGKRNTCEIYEAPLKKQEKKSETRTTLHLLVFDDLLAH